MVPTTTDDEVFLGQFHQALSAGPLDRPPDGVNPYYVPIYEDQEMKRLDPCRFLAKQIHYRRNEGSVQLFSGYRGSGKSTELLRLKRLLQDEGYQVVLCDMSDYVDLSTQVEIADFLIVLAGALGDALTQQEIVPGLQGAPSYWSHIVSLLKDLPGADAGDPIGLDGSPSPDITLRLGLREDPALRQRIRVRLLGHLVPLVRHVREYLERCRTQVEQRYRTPLVYLVDSMERMQGTYSNGFEVLNSVAELFGNHADKLKFPGIHLIYTIPPYLSVLTGGLMASQYGQPPVVLPTLKVRSKGDTEPFPPAYRLLEELITRRGDWRRLLGENHETHIQKIIASSGGHFRDLLLIFRTIISLADRIPVDAQAVDDALALVRRDYLTIAEEDILWLDEIATTNQPSLPRQDRLPTLARFLENNQVLCYRNGEPWYDVHPLVKEHVRREADRLRKRGRLQR